MEIKELKDILKSEICFLLENEQYLLIRIMLTECGNIEHYEEKLLKQLKCKENFKYFLYDSCLNVTDSFEFAINLFQTDEKEVLKADNFAEREKGKYKEFSFIF